MAKKFFFGLGLLALSALFWGAGQQFEQNTLIRLSKSALIISLVYFLFKFVLEEFVSANIEDLKTRYSLRKISSFLFIAISLLVLLHLWAVDTQTLLVSYGLVGAGVAVSLQDVFKNIAGGLLIFSTNIYRVGDRIEVDGIHGDVIDIGVLNTTVMELRNWVHGDQPTGRMVSLPNQAALWKNVHNYTRDHDFIWDEIIIPIEYESDWKRAAGWLETIAQKHTNEIRKKADKQLKSIAKRYYLPEKNTEPEVFVNPNDNWIALHLRYLTPILERRKVHNFLMTDILKKIESSKTVNIASGTTVIAEGSTIDVHVKK